MQRSEIWFEEYAAEHNLDGWCVHQPDLGSSARPDYRVELDGAGAICEVKEFTTSSLDRRLEDARFVTLSGHDVHATVRNKINKAAKRQLRPYADSGDALVVVLANPHDVRLSIYEPADVIEAMYGERSFILPVDPETGTGGKGHFAYAEGGVFGGGLHSYVSAVVILHRRERAADARERWLDENRHRWATIEDRQEAMVAVLEACEDQSFQEAQETQGAYYFANTFLTIAATTGLAAPLSAGLFNGPQDALWEWNTATGRFDLVSPSAAPLI